MTGLKVGDQMPDFRGIDQNGKEFTNTSFSGKKVVIYFYPKDNTPACTNQACSLRDSYQAIQQKGYSILGVSMDTDKMHTRFIEKFSLPFPLIADTERKMIDSFKVWGLKKFMGREYDGIHRTTFVINENGVITHIIEKPNTKNHGEEILNLL
ncbi:thioredoxin-dependent thiol peroxidase [Fluviicola taffensis]|uniref:thioredoxin-dependent peroxiredoxin n=1 Tax=Fluviicola taffensis (strain DSM 16823 / NCIMB 13979 / RW262) TaxID=755732 RepID=F2IGN2_FLUTR|nr:thioredoxin-dependent thiol peroxidase [Fluviicola taffensis]AEA43649.1 alkyl hydroperoxide reductase/ Thiol specific antioxidant/ Mal allergen [Fluviicola taffensis DSM 16823]